MTYFFFSFLAAFSLNYFEAPSDSVRIGIVSDSEYCGERELGWRIKIAAESLGWEVFLDEKRGKKLKKTKNLDWVICLLPANKHTKRGCPNYLTILHPLHYLDEEGSLRPFYEKYDGYLLTVDRTESFTKSLKSKKKELSYIPFYPSVQEVPYKKVALTNLTTLIPVWSNRITDQKYKDLYSLLSKGGFTKFYGIHENKEIIQNGYMGSLPFDGSSIIEVLQKHGIVLIIHSDIHNQSKIPTSRIFEAAAASVVIISDENAFVKTHFGDSVYFIDTSLTSNEIYLQIENHLKEIFENPETALEKAKRAHQIFLDKFLMTNQLIQLNSMHKRIESESSPHIDLFSWIEPIKRFLQKEYHSLLINPIPFTQLPNLDEQYSLINSVDFHPYENIFCSTYTQNNKIIFYKIDKDHQLQIIQTLRNPLANLSQPQHATFSPNGEKLVVANWDNQTLNIYLTEENGLFSEKPANVIPTPTPLVHCKPHGVAFSPCGNYLAITYAAGDDFENGIALFKSEGNNLECISIVKALDLPRSPKGIAFSPDGTCLLVTFCEENSIGIFTIENQLINRVPKQIIQGKKTRLSRPEDIKITFDKRFCAVSNSDQNDVTFYPFDEKSNLISQKNPCYTLQNSKGKLIFPHGIAFSSDGSYLVVTQFGKIKTTKKGNLFWDHTKKSTEAQINLYLIDKESSQLKESL